MKLKPSRGLRLGLGAASLTALAGNIPAMALTDAEIEAKLQEYEAKIKALEAKLGSQSPVGASSAAPVYEEDLARQVNRNEQKIDNLNQKLNDDSKLQVNGFVTAAATVANEDLNSYGLDETVNMRGLSKAGVQLTYNLTEKTDATDK